MGACLELILMDRSLVKTAAWFMVGFTTPTRREYISPLVWREVRDLLCSHVCCYVPFFKNSIKTKLQNSDLVLEIFLILITN